MSSLRRFSVSVEKDILEIVDLQVRAGKFPSRSDALRAMIRHQAAHAALEGKSDVIAMLGLTYDHHKRNLVSRMLHIQHDTPAKILGSQHFHIDHKTCVETILIKGKPPVLDRLLKAMQNIRGIQHATLSILAPL